VLQQAVSDAARLGAENTRLAQTLAMERAAATQAAREAEAMLAAAQREHAVAMEKLATESAQATAARDALQESIRVLDDDLRDADTTIRQLKSIDANRAAELKSLRDNNAKLEKEAASLRKSVKQLENTTKQLRDSNEVQRTRNGKLEEERTSKDTQIRTQATEIERLRAELQRAKESAVSSSSLSDSLNFTFKDLSNENEGLKRQVAALTDTKLELEVRCKKLQENARAGDKMVNELEEARGSLSIQVQEQSEEIANLKARLKERDKQRLEADAFTAEFAAEFGLDMGK
jgi:chromosome segregation ATPase